MDLTSLLRPPFVSGISGHSMDDYRKLPGVNPSWLAHMAKSPKHFRSAQQLGDSHTTATLIGSATHALILEPDTFWNHFCTYDGVRNPRHGAYAEFLDDHAGKAVLSPSEIGAAEAIALAVRADSIARPLIDLTDHERSVIGVVNGVQCKGRVDAFGGGYLLDVKTTTDVQMVPFGRVFANHNYALKLAMYQELLRENDQDIDHVILITCESAPPYDVACVEVPVPVLEHGLLKAKRLLTRLRECIDTDTWPGVANNQWYELSVPNWSMPEDEVLEVWNG